MNKSVAIANDDTEASLPFLLTEAVYSARTPT